MKMREEAAVWKSLNYSPHSLKFNSEKQLLTLEKFEKGTLNTHAIPEWSWEKIPKVIEKLS